MTDYLKLVRDARAGEGLSEQHLQELLATIPYTKFVGITARIKDGAVETQLPFQEHLIGNSRLPALHGGVIGSFLETTAIIEMLWRGQGEFLPKTISLTVDYLSTGKPETLFGRAHVSKQGRRVASVRVEAWQSDPNRLTATAHGNFMLDAPAD